MRNGDSITPLNTERISCADHHARAISLGQGNIGILLRFKDSLRPLGQSGYLPALHDDLDSPTFMVQLDRQFGQLEATS